MLGGTTSQVHKLTWDLRHHLPEFSVSVVSGGVQSVAPACGSHQCLQIPGWIGDFKKAFLTDPGKFPCSLKNFLVLRHGLMVSPLALGM